MLRDRLVLILHAVGVDVPAPGVQAQSVGAGPCVSEVGLVGLPRDTSSTTALWVAFGCSGGESGVAGHECGLDAVGDFEGGQNAADMGFDGAFTHGEASGDVGVGGALGDPEKATAFFAKESDR
ncbi:hypothetical protein SAMN02787144_1004360 [Streptomyces atratus]|uniref:Uncharacterized protein n=1 Tax=Streptomyces atratus TaxID=1893 RepID=A0A1K1YM24_STRAR|nr:hypothetical protein SAMN02787144_1004360 [Streptomyces atratus]